MRSYESGSCTARRLGPFVSSCRRHSKDARAACGTHCARGIAAHLIKLAYSRDFAQTQFRGHSPLTQRKLLHFQARARPRDSAGVGTAIGHWRTGRRMVSTTEVYCSSFMKPVSGEKALRRASQHHVRPRA